MIQPKRHFILYSIFFIAITVVNYTTVSCKGPVGPDGADAVIGDSLAPRLTWLEPQPGVIVDSLLVLRVTAMDENGIWRMSFFVGGFEYPGELVDTLNSQYQLLWSAELFPAGPYPILARAWDNARNMGETPTRIIYVEHP